MPPQRPNLVLSTNIPNIKLHIFVGHALYVKADRRDGSDILIGEFQFVENSCTEGGSNN